MNKRKALQLIIFAGVLSLCGFLYAYTMLPQLDFIHLDINKKRGKLQQILDQEVAHAYPANRIYHDPGSLCEAVLEADLGTCEDFVVGCHSFSGRTNGDGCFAGDGIELGKAFSELSSLRITPALFSLFSVVTLLANLHACKQTLPIQQAAWYFKKLPTFSDALHIVKESLYSHPYFQTSYFDHEVRKLPQTRPPYRLVRFPHASGQVPFG